MCQKSRQHSAGERCFLSKESRCRGVCTEFDGIVRPRVFGGPTGQLTRTGSDANAKNGLGYALCSGFDFCQGGTGACHGTGDFVDKECASQAAIACSSWAQSDSVRRIEAASVEAPKKKNSTPTPTPPE